MGLEIPLWRALTVFRVATLGYAVVLMVGNFRHYARPAGGWAVVGFMALWTAAASWAYASPQRRGWPLLGLDLAVAAGCLLSSRWVVCPSGVALGAPTLPMAWVAAPVIAWAIFGGRWCGVAAAALMGIVDAVVRAGVSQGTINGTVLMLLAGIAVGHTARLAGEAEARMQHAVELEAATRERERLARGIHDSVLQVLALVQRRGTELGGEAAELGRLAGAQEATLRALVATGPGGPTAVTGTAVASSAVTGAAVTAAGVGVEPLQVDLRTAVESRATATVTVAVPATEVWLPGQVASEVAAVIGAALDNVRTHAGDAARAWILVEDEPAAVTVTVRDDGRGIPAGRLAEARAAGRLGVVQSIEGRVRDLGGTVTIASTPGCGTEIEFRVPRRP